MTVVGVWERGSFEPALPDVLIHDNTVLLLAGSQEAIDRYNEQFRTYNVSKAPVVILGGGRVGRATGRALAKRGLDYRIVEILPERIRNAIPRSTSSETRPTWTCSSRPAFSRPRR